MALNGRGGGGETLTERSKGKDVRNSNIVAAKAVAAAIRTSLGPRGMDKLIQKSSDKSVIISNDGATILSHMKVLHPAAKLLVELSQAQDVAAGDGTTTVVVLAGALLEACAALLRKGIHPTQIASSFLKAATVACDALRNKTITNGGVSKPIDLNDRESLLQAVHTCLSSKVVAQHSELLAPMAVDSVLALLNDKDDTDHDTDSRSQQQHVDVDLRDIRLVQQMGGTVEDSELITAGLVLSNKAAAKSAAGAVSNMKDCHIGFIQYCLSAPKTDMDNNVVVEDYASMDRILREERKYLLEQCKIIKKAGVNVLLIQKSILRDAYNELSLHFLAKMGILVVTDIDRGDVDFICRTLGCVPVAHPDQWSSTNTNKLGHCETVQTVYLEGASNKVVKFLGVKNPGKTVTILLRGSNEQVLQEAARSLHDAHCVVRSLVKCRALTAGGGASEIYAARYLQQQALTITTSSSTSTGTTSANTADDGSGNGKDAYCFAAFAEALETIPYTLAENAGMKPVDVVTALRAKQAAGHACAGIHIAKGTVVENMYDYAVVQPLLVTTSAITLATETVSLIMKVDDLIVVQ